MQVTKSITMLISSAMDVNAIFDDIGPLATSLYPFHHIYFLSILVNCTLCYPPYVCLPLQCLHTIQPWNALKSQLYTLVQRASWHHQLWASKMTGFMDTSSSLERWFPIHTHPIKRPTCPCIPHHFLLRSHLWLWLTHPHSYSTTSSWMHNHCFICNIPSPWAGI